MTSCLIPSSIFYFISPTSLSREHFMASYWDSTFSIILLHSCLIWYQSRKVQYHIYLSIFIAHLLYSSISLVLICSFVSFHLLLFLVDHLSTLSLHRVCKPLSTQSLHRVCISLSTQSLRWVCISLSIWSLRRICTSYFILSLLSVCSLLRSFKISAHLICLFVKDR